MRAKATRRGRTRATKTVNERPLISSPTPADLAQPHPAKPFYRSELWGLVLLVCALAYSAWYVAPELRIGRVPLNDVVFHLAASQRLGQSLAQGEPFMDPWVSEWALGYPVWQSYQPVPHLVAALWLRVFGALSSPAAIFAALLYGLIITFPVSVYIGARLLGLSPPAAGLAALLVFAPSSSGELGSYGIGYGAVLWRGSGLYTQLFALHGMALGLGLTARALDAGGRWRRFSAAAALALTALCHIIFGYAAFVSAALLAIIGPHGERARRLLRLAAVVVPALLLLAWFVLPLVMVKGTINHSRWELPAKWNSFGAPYILGELLAGRMLDFGRAPVLSVLLAIGVSGAVLSWRDPLARRLLGLCGVWLGLFFGRETWGHLVLFAGVPADLPMHRLQAVFELSAILLTAYGVVRIIAWVAQRSQTASILAVIMLAVGLGAIGSERAGYLEQNQTWGEQNLADYDREQGDLNSALADVRAILAERPGRVSAGLAATWGTDFKIGAVPVYAFLTRDHMDQASFLYHAMSRPSEVMVARNERSAQDDAAFGIRAIIAPANQPMPPHLKLRAVHGRFAVYESSAEGYFGLVDIGGHYTGPPSTFYEPSSAWLNSPLLSSGVVLSLDANSSLGPAVPRWAPLPPVTPEQMRPRGRIIAESKSGETYRARYVLERPAYALVKITWHPSLVATVDGRPATLIPVTPGFGAVAVPAGQHEVEVSYRPGPLRALLLIAGLGLFGLVAIAFERPRVHKAGLGFAKWLDQTAEPWKTPRVAAAAVLAVASIVALHPLFHGQLVAGHDATEYPPRLVEFSRILLERQLPPIWAPDLGAGHGQPLFEFAPPLVYVAALPFKIARFGLADSLQFGLAALHILGVIAFYRIGRRLKQSRTTAVAGAICWLFMPYLAMDLFVRGAFAEASALAILPVALLGLIEAMERPTAARVAWGAVGTALVMLAHNAVALLVMPAFAGVVLLRGWVAWQAAATESLQSRLRPVLAGASAMGLGFGLSAYFWVPAMLEKGLVRTALLRSDFMQYLVWTRELLWSPWGYGTSVPGLHDGMSFALGPVHLLLAIAGCIVAWRSRDRRTKAYAFAFAAAGILGAWLSTRWASAAWEHVALLQYMAFPWRALVLPGLMMPLLALFAFERLGPRWTMVAVGALVLFNLPHTEPKSYLPFDDEYYEPAAIARNGINTTTFEEYEPRWVASRPPYEASGLIGAGGPLEEKAVSSRSWRQEYSVQTAAATAVQSSTFFYPGWEVMVDGVTVPVSRVPVSGTMQFTVPAGQHRIVLELKNTRIRIAAIRLSLSAFLILVIACVPSRWRGKRTTSSTTVRQDQAQMAKE